MFVKFERVNFDKNIRIFIIVVLILSQVQLVKVQLVKAMPNSQVVLTIGALVGLGHVISNQFKSSAKVAGDEVRSVIRTGGDEVRKTFDNASENVDKITNQIETTYRNSLNVTFDKLDKFTQDTLLGVLNLFNRVNAALQDDVKLIAQKTLEIITEISVKAQAIIGQLEESAKKIIIVAGVTTVYVVDRFWDGFLAITAFVVAAVAAALLGTRLLKKDSLPKGLQGIAGLTVSSIFIILGLLIFFSPFEFRTKALAYTGMGLNYRIENVKEVKDDAPIILGVYPKTVLVGEYKELQIRGTGLKPEGKKISAEIGNSETGFTNLPIKVSTESEIIFDTTNLQSPAIGSNNIIRIKYDGAEVLETGVTLEVFAPARLVITSINFESNPSSDGRYWVGIHINPGQKFIVDVTVANQGDKDSGSFTVGWKSTWHVGYSRPQNQALKGGEQVTYRFDDFTFNGVPRTDKCGLFTYTMENSFNLTTQTPGQFDETRSVLNKQAVFVRQELSRC